MFRSIQEIGVRIPRNSGDPLVMRAEVIESYADGSKVVMVEGELGTRTVAAVDLLPVSVLAQGRAGVRRNEEPMKVYPSSANALGNRRF